MRRAGRVTLTISAQPSGGILLTVARACSNPKVLKLADEVIAHTRQQVADTVVKEVEPEVPFSALTRKRGGPKGRPETQRIEIVKGWFKVQGKMKAVDYAHSRGISAATLRRWVRELLDTGKL